jgi:hypothetical protein
MGAECDQFLTAAAAAEWMDGRIDNRVFCKFSSLGFWEERGLFFFCLDFSRVDGLWSLPRKSRQFRKKTSWALACLLPPKHRKIF